MHRKVLVSSLALLLLSGCATSVPMGDADTDAALKRFVPPAGLAGLYVFRNETYGAAHKLDVLIDGVEIGSTSAKTYLYKALTPGRHTVTSKGEDRSSVEVTVDAGTLLFVWQEAKFGTINLRSKLHVVSEASGQKGVQESRLARP